MEYVIKLPDGYYGGDCGDEQTRWLAATDHALRTRHRREAPEGPALPLVPIANSRGRQSAYGSKSATFTIALGTANGEMVCSSFATLAGG
jgi:hypothetical protein